MTIFIFTRQVETHVTVAAVVGASKAPSWIARRRHRPRTLHAGNYSRTVAGNGDYSQVTTRQLSYRKEDRAMRPNGPIHRCPEKFPESSLHTRLLFPKFVMGFCSDRY